MQKFTSKVLEIKQLTPTVKQFRMSVPDDFTFQPGQFVITHIINAKGEKIKRSYSIASEPKEGYIELCLNKVPGGQSSEFYFNLKEGDSVDYTGAVGPFKIKDKTVPMTFISTGTGIAPFRSMINSLLQNGCNQTILLLVGHRYEEEELYKEWKEELKEKYVNFEYHTIISRPGESYTGEKGYVQELINKHITKFDGHFYICGMKAMIKDVEKLLLEKGVSEDRIFFEKYD